MNRELKFRAWNHKSKTMYYDVCIDKNGHANNGKSYLTYNKEKDAVMQFTGLKDRAGNEIYEGDVATSRYGIGEVYWNSGTGRFCFEFDTDSDGLWEMCSGLEGDSFEVIGNIYHNKDLRLPNRTN